MVFLETEGDKLTPTSRSIWNNSSTLPADLPTGINVLLLTRAVDTHVLILLFRHTAPSVQLAFPGNILPEGKRGYLDS